MRRRRHSCLPRVHTVVTHSLALPLALPDAPAPGEYVPVVDTLGNKVLVQNRTQKGVLPKELQTFGTSNVRFRQGRQVGAGPGAFGKDWTKTVLAKPSFNVTRGARAASTRPTAKDRKQRAAAQRRTTLRRRAQMDHQDLAPTATAVKRTLTVNVTHVASASSPEVKAAAARVSEGPELC